MSSRALRREVAYAAVVLAGGRARRMGQDKVVLPVGGVPLLRRVLAAVADAVSVVVVGPPRDVPGGLDCPVARWSLEDPPGGGPAAALGAGLRALDEAGSTAEYVAVLAADLPFVSADVVRRLLAALASSADAGVVAVDDSGCPQWLLSAWRKPALAGLHYPASTSLRAVLGPSRPGRLVLPTAAGLPPWTDCDTPHDLEQARRLSTALEGG